MGWCWQLWARNQRLGTCRGPSASAVKQHCFQTSSRAPRGQERLVARLGDLLRSSVNQADCTPAGFPGDSSWHRPSAVRRQKAAGAGAAAQGPDGTCDGEWRERASMGWFQDAILLPGRRFQPAMKAALLVAMLALGATGALAKRQLNQLTADTFPYCRCEDYVSQPYALVYTGTSDVDSRTVEHACEFPPAYCITKGPCALAPDVAPVRPGLAPTQVGPSPRL